MPYRRAFKFSQSREPKTIGERIRKLRIALDWTQADLAEIVGCDPSSVAKWEGDKTPPICYLVELASALEVSESHIMTGEK